jgi:uncharacterized protein YjbI with pentapeptide repeats
MTSAKMGKTNLRSAILANAKFNAAVLDNADLRNADLTYTEFGTATKMNTKFE